MTQAELGRRVGLTAHFICEIEKGKRKPSLDKAQAIAAVLGITVDEAFEHVDVPSSAAVAS